MVVGKYGVRLSPEDRAQLERLIRSGQHSVRIINRARIPLKTDAGWSASQVAEALDTSPRTVFRIKRRYADEGLAGRLSLQREGCIIAVQEAPPSPGSLRDGIKPPSGNAVPSPHLEGLREPQETAHDRLTMIATENGHGSVIDDEDVVSMTVTISPKRPTFLKRPDGTRCRRPSSRACPFARWQGSWVSTEIP